MFRKILVLSWLIAIAHSGLGQTLGFSLAHGKKKVEIPIEIYNNLVVVPVILNGALPLKFILDTGVRTAILTQKAFTDILNLTYSRKYTIAGPGGTKLIDAYVTNNVSLDLPGVEGKGHALLVLEEDYLELRNYMGTDVHGILGYELFSRFIAEIDYERKMLTLFAPGRFKKPRKFQTLSIHIEDTKPYVTTELVLSDGAKLNAKLLMDTGASHGLMIDPKSNALIQIPSNAISSLIGRGLGGIITGKVGRIQSLSLGSYKLNDVIVNFPDPNSYMDSLKIGSTFRNGAIGGEVLSRFTVIFNFPQEQVYLKKNVHFKNKFHYNLSGITVKAKGASLKDFEITEVREKSVAQKAEILGGDIIISINGILSSELNLNEINEIFSRKPGKKVSMEIERNGERLKKEFVLEDQI